MNILYESTENKPEKNIGKQHCSLCCHEYYHRETNLIIFPTFLLCKYNILLFYSGYVINFFTQL